MSLSADRLLLATPHAGTLAFPARLVSVDGCRSRPRRCARHQAASSRRSTLDDSTDPRPAPPEGGVFERAWDLPSLPAAAATLVLDVVQVAGEAPDLEFAALVKKGECRTNLKLNGEPFDYLNRYIVTRNETPDACASRFPVACCASGKT